MQKFEDIKKQKSIFEERTPVGDKSLLGRSQNAFEKIYQKAIQMSRNPIFSN